LKVKIDNFIYQLFTNLELSEQLHIPLAIINTNMFTYLGSTLPIKKKSKLFYYFYLSIIVSIQDLNSRQVINTVRLRASIVSNYSELKDIDTMLQKKLRSIPINYSVMSILLAELN